MIKSKMSVIGYDLLGVSGEDGIRYAWHYNGGKQLVESAAFPQHRKNVRDNICGYTTSVSSGCILKALRHPCSFCRTGKLLSYVDSLTAIDIARQNIFMVLADMKCSEHKHLVDSPREFAYMGQGEPGYSYPQVREAIRITNAAMKMLGQKVHRHIISTSGILEMILAFKDDLKNGFFTERVTIHFSLHSGSQREIIMPIETKYPFIKILDSMSDIVDLSGEKPCIGILLFKDYQPSGRNIIYSNELLQIKEILKYINPDKFRLSFCEYNDSDDVGKAGVYDPEMARNVLEYAKNNGFEAKLFSSFGKNENTACGMLGSKSPDFEVSEKWLNIQQEVDDILSEIYTI